MQLLSVSSETGTREDSGSHRGRFAFHHIILIMVSESTVTCSASSSACLHSACACSAHTCQAEEGFHAPPLLLTSLNLDPETFVSDAAAEGKI